MIQHLVAEYTDIQYQGQALTNHPDMPVYTANKGIHVDQLTSAGSPMTPP
jgi:hypothetical protein